MLGHKEAEVAAATQQAWREYHQLGLHQLLWTDIHGEQEIFHMVSH